MTKNLAFVLALATASAISASPLEIKDLTVAPHISGTVKLIHENNHFSIIQDDAHHEVKSYWVDKKIRNIDSLKLRNFLEHGYIAINQLDNGEFCLNGKPRLMGGGPIAASIAYWVTKSVCYGTAAAAAGTVVVATGGAAGAATGALAAAGTAGASTGATIAAGAIAGAGLTDAAVVATTGVITSAGTLAGAVAAVETASAGAAAFFLALPIP